MIKGVTKAIWLVTMILVANTAFSQVEIDDAIVKNFWRQWANADSNGKNAGTVFSDSLPGYVYNYRLVEDVEIDSNDNTEKANSKNKDGAIVLMVPHGQPDEMAPGLEYPVSTDEAMGYGMLLAVMMDDQELFNKFLRVVNYFDDIKEPKLTSWVIPALEGESLKTGVYAELEKELKAIENKTNFTKWKDGYPADFSKWAKKYAPKYVDNNYTIQGVAKEVDGKPTIDGYAMDGELDIAFALLLAHDKWVLKGTSKYKYLAMSAERYSAIMDDVRIFGTHKNPDKSEKKFLPTGPFRYSNWKYLKERKYPGKTDDEIDEIFKTEGEYFDGTRPCDWMLSHFRAYYEVTGDVKTRELIGSLQEQMNHFESTDGDGTNDTGLVPDFAFFEKKVTGTEKLVPVEGFDEIYTVGETNAGDYYMNSARYTARLAMDYLFYKDEYSLNKAIDIVEYLDTKDNPFRPARNIETGEIPATKYDYEQNWKEVPSEYDTWENRILRACLLMAAGAEPGNPVLSKFYEEYKNEPDPLNAWKPEFFGKVFRSQYPSYKHYVAWVDDKGKDNWVAFPKLGADPGATEYFNDTWVLLTLGVLNGDLYRPHAFPNELDEAPLDSWEISKGSDYVTITRDSTNGTIIVEVDSLPTSDDPYEIILSTDDFDSWPGSGFGFDMVLERQNMDASTMKVRHSYPGLKDSKVVELDEKKIASDFEDVTMHYMGHFGPALKGHKKEQVSSKIEIGINSGLTENTKLIFSKLGLYDPPGDANKYKYVGPWKSDQEYKVGDYVRYNMETYQCIKDHIGSLDENPVDAPDLWEKSDYTLIGSEWATNTFYFRGDLVYYQGRTYMAQISFTSVNPPPEAEAVWMIYHDPFVGYAQDWFRGGFYRKGDYTLYNGNAYICKTNHKSIPGWNPETAYTLWEKANYLFIEIDPQPWESWTPYQAGAVVVFNDIKYECVIGHTAQPGWEPDVPGAIWKEYTK